MPNRSTIYTDHSPARIDPPTFPPRTVFHHQHDKTRITEQSTYSEILSAIIAPDLPAEYSVEEYDGWIKAQKTRKVNLPDDILSVTPSTATLIKKYNKKAKKAAKVDKFKLFLEGRDGTSPVSLPFLYSLGVRVLMIDPLQPYYQRHIRLVDTRLSMKPEKKKKKEERGSREMRDLFDGKYACVEVVEVEPIEEVKVDINDAL